MKSIALRFTIELPVLLQRWSADSEDYDANPGVTIDEVMEDVQPTDAPTASSKPLASLTEPSTMCRSPIL